MPPRILIVDDERDACTSLRRILRLDGYEVDIAHSVSETMSPREWSDYFVVVLDRKLPDGTAETLLPWIRQRAPSTAIVIVTGYADLESSIAAIREGAEDYIIKPINPDVLRASLARILRMRDAEARAVQAERLAAIGQMVASLAHESRNLLQRMSASIEILELIDADNPDAMEEITKIRNAENGLEQLLEEIREFAAPIHLHKKLHSLQSVWQEAWASLCETKEDRDSQIDSTCDGVDTTCQIDAFRIGQVFRNLFENSIAACGHHAHISVRCESTDGLLRVTVRDNGPGLNAEQQKNAFNPFFTTKAKGTGLGLAIAKRIIEAHGGDIRLGNLTEGAEFVISLPVGPA
jgi:signal transduction histidine kinase